ncbi:hypothetical protein KFL_001820030 [Klebsormidium nitens]|uniref:DNA-directed primase/polymerase protein n=1 Tax=Klebsormidium nitens TaxID=105231 RepID=A0A1Y1HZY8_KLENI|nr:hypothetical protein KFL_001820030 [Klebsormidium nitens]|eukprot:GAQ84250.1 hypothetical protein KFL_001820030 [Klebsormidium nitens]
MFESLKKRLRRETGAYEPPSFELIPEPQEVLRDFVKQDEALAFARSCSSCYDNQLYIFAKENPETGGRTFFVSTFSNFFTRWSSHKLPGERHFYEVIYDKCNLFVDIDGDRSALPSLLEVEEGIEQSIQLVDQLAHHVFRAHLDWGRVVEMDASNSVKFSRHLVLPFFNHHFTDTKQAGRFISQASAASVCQELTKRTQNGDKRYLPLVKTWTEQGEALLLIDQAVYTKNRQFRTFGSTKFRSTNDLKLTNRYYETKGPKEDLRHSLVGNVPRSSKELTAHTQIPPPSRKLNDTKPETETQSLYIPFRDEALEQYLKSCTRSLCTDENASIQSGKLYSHNYVIYNITDSTFCPVKKGEHKKHSAYWVVDTADSCTYLKCHDVADCEGRKSTIKPLPKHLALKLKTTVSEILQIQEMLSQDDTIALFDNETTVLGESACSPPFPHETTPPQPPSNAPSPAASSAREAEPGASGNEQLDAPSERGAGLASASSPSPQKTNPPQPPVPKAPSPAASSAREEAPGTSGNEQLDAPSESATAPEPPLIAPPPAASKETSTPKSLPPKKRPLTADAQRRYIEDVVQDTKDQTPDEDISGYIFYWL